ncbi:MAG: hypothetical protein ACOYBE_13165 [Blautia sp.]|jgi:site-specific DNA recombinase
MFKDETGQILSAMVGEERRQAANQVLKRRSEARSGHENNKWACSGKIKNSRPFFPIYKTELKPLLYEVFRDTENIAQALVKEYIALYKSLDRDSGLPPMHFGTENRHGSHPQKQQKLLTFNALGELSGWDFLTMNRRAHRSWSAHIRN